MNRFEWGDGDLVKTGHVYDSVDDYSNDPDEPVLFYGGPLSNFVPSLIVLEAFGSPRTYPTVEHYFQAAKATNEEEHELVRCAAGPAMAKSRGRVVQLREDWSPDGVEFDEWAAWREMLRGLRAKFALPGYRLWLLWTGDRFIAENSPTDSRWGIRDAQGGWTGSNLLGRALMLVRDEIREEETS